MKFTILTIVVVFAAAQSALGNPQPNLLANIGTAINSAVSTVEKAVSNIFPGSATTTQTTTATTAAPIVKTPVSTPPGTTADDVIKSAIDATNQLITDSNTKLNSIIPKQAGNSPATLLTNTIAQSSQIIKDAVADETTLTDNTSQSLQNIINNDFTSGKGFLNDRIDNLAKEVNDISAEVQSLKLAPLIGHALTNVTNQGLAIVAKALANQTNLHLITNAVDVLSKVAILNKLIANITAEAGLALHNIVVPTGTLTKIQTALYGSDIENAIDNATAAGVQDLSTVTIPLTPAVNNTVNGIISALASGEQEISKVIDTFNSATPAIEAATKSTFQEIASVLAQSALGPQAAATISNIISSVQNTVAGLLAVLKFGFPSLTNAITEMSSQATDTQSNGGLAANFLSCLNTETVTYQGVQVKYESLITEYRREVANGAIIASTVQNTIIAAGDLALTVGTTLLRVEVCETIQASNTANVVLPAVSKVVSALVK